MDISVIVVSYNTLELTKDTLDAIQKSFSISPHLKWELIVVDNASVDGSAEMLKKYKPHATHCRYIPVISKENVGFGKGNNLGMTHATGKYILLLNSDLIADSVDFSNIVDYMDEHPKVGGLTVRVEFKNGQIDPASHRGFPNLWRSFAYFSKLQKITYPIPALRSLFGGYHLLHMNLDEIHEIDSPTGAFFIIRGSVIKKLHGFDEDYFMYGEDLDLAMRIKEKGFSILYYPLYTVIHLKHQSGLKTKKKKTQSITTYHFYNAMKIFYDKHYAQNHSAFVNWFVHKAIDVKYFITRF